MRTRASLTLTLIVAATLGIAAACDPVPAPPPGHEQAVFTCSGPNDIGTEDWTVPAGVTSATLDVYGAQGGSANLTSGGAVLARVATLAVAPGQVIEVTAGCRGASPTGGGCSAAPGGWPLGGQGGRALPTGDRGGAGGGGYSAAVQHAASGIAATIIAGGGGGAGFAVAGSGGAGIGGVGGHNGTAGTNGASTPVPVEGGGGGTQTAVGHGGAGTDAGLAGTEGFGNGGGRGGEESARCDNNPSAGGGGGGAGHFGGGGGGGHFAVSNPAAGGGGGASSTGPSGTQFQDGVRSGNGRVIINYPAPG